MKKAAKDVENKVPKEIDDGKGLERMTELVRKVVSVPREKIEERERVYREGRNSRSSG